MTVTKQVVYIFGCDDGRYCGNVEERIAANTKAMACMLAHEAGWNVGRHAQQCPACRQRRVLR